MFEWSEKFETQIEIVDTQHKKLVSLLDKLCQALNTRTLTEELLNDVLQQLVQYAAQHFADEEQLMLETKVSEKHTILHKMEHHSFIYDIDRMRNYFSPDIDIFEIAEKLVQFIAAWLTYHILGIDKIMADQIKDIKLGMNPDTAYNLHRKGEYDIATTRLLFDAVLKMWKQSNDHSLRVEQQLAQCLSEKQNH
jgi:hemerythrin